MKYVIKSERPSKPLFDAERDLMLLGARIARDYWARASQALLSLLCFDAAAVQRDHRQAVAAAQAKSVLPQPGSPAKSSGVLNSSAVFAAASSVGLG